MGWYVRFEIYLPVHYKDNQGNAHHVDPAEITELGNAIANKFGGLTESNPSAGPPFKGRWWSDKGLIVDYSISMFVLVRQERLEEAREFFTEMKAQLEGRYAQEFVVVMFSNVQTIGEL